MLPVSPIIGFVVNQPLLMVQLGALYMAAIILVAAVVLFVYEIEQKEGK